MTATPLDGKALAARLRERIAKEIADTGLRPGLAAVLVGDDPASKVYVGMKHRDAESVGMLSRQELLPAGTSQAELEALVDELNAADDIHGILVQLPLPDQLDTAAITGRVSPGKDVDGLGPTSVGQLALGSPTFVPCTPYGVLEILADAGVELAGAEVVVVGRSNLVGRPLATLLAMKGRDATVTLAHSRTRDLGEVTRRADVLVAAAGREGLVTGDMVKPGAVVIDVGTNRSADGSLVGDVVFDEVAEVAGMLTPVPGGVGPMTRAMLLQNTLEAARSAAGMSRRP